MEVGGRSLRKRKPAQEPAPPAPAKKKKQQQQQPPRAAGRRKTRQEPPPEPSEEEAEDAEEGKEAESSEDPESNEIEVEQPVWQGAPKTANARKKAPGGDYPASIVSMTFKNPTYSQIDATQQSLSQAEVEEASRRSLALHIHQLYKLSNDLAEGYKKGSESGVFLGMEFHIPRAAFDGARRLFPKVPGLSDDALFIDPGQFEDLEADPTTGISVVDIVHRVNLVTALDMIEQLFENPRKATSEEILRPIAALDDYLHGLMLPFGDDAANVNYAFDLRALRALQMLPTDRELNRKNVASTLSKVFCVQTDTPNKDPTIPLTEGPYRELCHRVGSEPDEGDDVDELCSRRLAGIFKRIIHNKKYPRLDEVRKEYDITQVFQKLSSWVTQVYFDSDPLKTTQTEEEGEEDEGRRSNIRPHNRPYTKPYVVEEGSVASQPIIRASDVDPTRPTMFSSGALDALQGDDDSDEEPEFHDAEQGPPVDPVYMHENADILGHRPSETNGSPTASNVSKPRRQKQPPRSTAADDEDGDDDFETDTRPVSEARRLALQKTRASNRSPLPQSSAGHSIPQERLPSPNPASSAPLEAIRQEKRNVSTANRTFTGPSVPRQRHPWSDNDSQTLIELIGLRHAAWSTIESCDKHKFEQPRNQQAYRDKARNMKVDMLLTDAVLPVNFDLVMLGKKEIDRVTSFGKNPSRKENDMHEGRAINTEYHGA